MGKQAVARALGALVVVGLLTFGGCSGEKTSTVPLSADVLTAASGDVDIARMERETGISKSIIKDAIYVEKIAMRRLAAATTVEEVREVYRNAPSGSAVEKAATEKWLSLAATAKEMHEMVYEVYQEAYYEIEVRKAVAEKWLSLAATVEEVYAVYRNAPYGSEVRKAAVEKWLSLAATVEEVREVYRNAPEGSEVRKAAIRKLATFFPKQK